MVPMFRTFIEENEDKEEMAEEEKQQRLEKEVEKELDSAMGPFYDLEGELKKIDGQYPVSDSEEEEEIIDQKDVQSVSTKADTFMTENSKN